MMTPRRNGSKFFIIILQELVPNVLLATLYSRSLMIKVKFLMNIATPIQPKINKETTSLTSAVRSGKALAKMTLNNMYSKMLGTLEIKL